MSSSPESFGRMAARVGSASELLELERAHGRQEGFAELDRLVGEFFVSSLKGERVLSVNVQDESGVAGGNTVALRWEALPEPARGLLDDQFSLERQQSRGTWHLPDEVSAKVQLTQFAANLRDRGRFAHTITSEGRHTVALAGSPEAVCYWAVLEPLFADLYKPFLLRSEQTGKKTREQQLEQWRVVDELYDALGFNVDDQLSVMRYGGGWSRLRAQEQLAAKRNLAGAMAEQAELRMGACYRAYRTLPVFQRYYAKAKADGRALRKQVLTRQLDRALSGFFGGDWLALLDYLGEEPHPEEQITTALPDTRLYIGPSQKSAEVAARHGLDEAQLDLILGALYGTGGRASPVQRRVDVLKRYWGAFDELHAKQRSGMDTLWGLVEEGRWISLFGGGESPRQGGLYRRLLPTDLLDEVDECWGTVMLDRWPEKIVTEPFPHASMAETFGPALKFWQGCALTAWFLCEGPYSRTDMSGLEHYHRREVSQLEDLGIPIDKSMFRELIDLESRLEPAEPIYDDIDEVQLDSGLVLRTSISGGTRRKGFERLRDVITKYRRAWASNYLDAYFSARAEGEIREAVRRYYKSTYDRGGKTPTAKQFAKTAREPTNHWFGGDVGAFYRAFGEKSPVMPQRVRLMPVDPESFVAAVYTTLGGTREQWNPYISDEKEAEAHRGRMDANRARASLAHLALEYVQLEEALNRKPELKDLGRGKFEHRASVLGDDSEEAWRSYVAVVEEARNSLSPEQRPTIILDSHDRSSSLSESQPATNAASADERELERKSERAEQEKEVGRSWFKRLMGR